MKTESLARKQTAPVGYGHTSDLFPDAVAAISANLRQLLADVFALYLKTKNFHWHMTGRHFRDHHLLLDEQAEQIFSMTDDIAERARKLGRSTLRSISDIANNQRLKDNNEAVVAPADMILELAADNQRLIEFMRQSHELCDEHNDVATTSLIEVWIDQAATVLRPVEKLLVTVEIIESNTVVDTPDPDVPMFTMPKLPALVPETENMQ